MPVARALLDDAVAFARAAGDLTLTYFRSRSLVVDDKADGTPVTEADRAAERLLRELIGARYPDDAIAGEEEADQAGTSGRRWIVDPIDGTKAFTRGVPLYCNLVAVEDGEGAAVGVINLPALGETVYAGRGHGCWCNDSPTRVNDTDDLARAYLTTSGLDGWPERVLSAAVRSPLKLRTWGDGYGYALVATGRCEAMVDLVVAEYDVAAMPVIMAEAGGRFTDLHGRSGATGGSGLASNGRLHDELLALLGERSEPTRVAEPPVQDHADADHQQE